MTTATTMTPSILTTLTRRKTGTIAQITISRPQKLNALNTPLLEKLPQTFQTLSTNNPDLLGIVLTGAGSKSFVGGADIAEMARLESPVAARAFITKVHRACAGVRDCPVPVIARVNGYALGAGCELAAACDLRVGSRNAVFGMPEVRVGIPSVVEAALLPNLIGWGRTRQMLLLGENISADEAFRWGLIEKIVEQDALDEAVEGWLSQLERNGPLAVRRQKALMRTWENVSLGRAIQAGVDAFGESFAVMEGRVSEPVRMMGAFFQGQAKRGGSA